MRFILSTFGIVPTAAFGLMMIMPRPVAQAQESVRPHPEFDVASVKIDNDTLICCQFKGGPGTSDPGRITYSRMPLWVVIRLAYDVQADQIFGRLNDIQADKFTISATMAPTTTSEQFRIMLQNLLAERFHLVLHHESRDFPGYDLVVASGGPKFNEWIPDPNAAAIGPRGQAGQPGYVNEIPPGPPIVRVTNRQSMADFSTNLEALVLMSEAVSNAMNGKVPLDQRLMPARGQNLPVSPTPRIANKTGLTGIYEFRLEFEGTYMTGTILSNGGPNIFTALEKQLGLKLVKVKSVPVDVLVVDHVDKVPTEN